MVASLGNRRITVDTGNLTSDTLQELIDTECPVDFTSTTLNHLIRLFSVDFGDEAAPGEVMKRLRYCNMMSLNLPGCSHLPAAAWKQLHGAKWPRLKKANFDRCLARERNGYRIRCLCVFFHGVSTQWVLYSIYLVWKISPSSGSMPAFFGKALHDLTLDQHSRCFGDQGEGAANLLGALGHWQELEDVNFEGCSKIPAAAWQQLRGAKWPRLKKANFYMCLTRERNG